MLERNFTIKKGWHYALPFFIVPSFKKSFNFTAEISESCIYHQEGEDTYDINKLFGIGNGFNHHVNSVRIGWRCIDNQNFELVTYQYIDKIRQPEQTLLFIKPDEKVSCQIFFVDDQAVVTATALDKNKTIVLNMSKKQKFGFLLWPYFGGNNAAPHQMKIKLTFK